MLWALLGALAVGLSLGLMGSGGSILTVPVLTYVVGQDEKVAIAGSLGIVGTISLVAAVPYALRRQLDSRSVLYFGLPGMLGAYSGAHASQYVTGAVQLAVFALLMLFAGVLMLRPQPAPDPTAAGTRPAFKIVLEGLVVGAVTGFVGVGGGFLIVPALVLLGGLSMHRAVGTSLVIIALKSFVGFWKYAHVLRAADLALDPMILTTFSALGIAGSLAGRRVGTWLPQHVLRRVFAVFLFVVGAFVVLKSWPELFEDEPASGAPSEEPPPEPREDS